MTKFSKTRLLVPTTVFAAGTVIAGAVDIGHTWSDALIAEVVTVAIAVAYYAATGRDSDVGAIYGQRSDERQGAIRMQASRLAFVVMLCAAFVCAVVTVALNDSYWQADAIGGLGALTFLLGLRTFGAPTRPTSDESRGVMDAGVESRRDDRAEDFSNS